MTGKLINLFRRVEADLERRVAERWSRKQAEANECAGCRHVEYHGQCSECFGCSRYYPDNYSDNHSDNHEER